MTGQARRAPRTAPSPFGAVLRGYRVAARLTQEELAERSGLTARSISNLERGQTRRPSRASAEFLARALALPEADAAKFVAAARGSAPGVTAAQPAGAPGELALAPGRDDQTAADPAAVASSAPRTGRPGTAGTGVTGAAVPIPAESAELPAQLPADIGNFTGRDLELRQLCDMLARPDPANDPPAVLIVVIAGVAGLGKTTLAVHAAHLVRSFFPDGQLYADMSGTSSEPVAPGEVLARFLRDLGVDGDRVPAGDDERAGLYRTRLSGRRVLILLDDLKDAAQARPLLPGSSSCAVLVTTRNRTPSSLSSQFISLDTLSGPEALELFSQIAGEGRAAAEPEATGEILRACAGLPLAIKVCATRLATRSQWRVSTMATRLRDERRRLDELQLGDLEVRASFQVSYDSLHTGRQRADPARMFRLLGLWQAQKLSLPAAAALAGERETGAAAALETLVDANLLESPAPDWYQFHDLLHLFASELVQAEELEGGERHEAVARLLRWYLGTALSAAECLSPHRYRIPPDEPRPPYMSLSSVEAALDWYDSERSTVMTAVRQAAAAGLHDIAWRLPTTLFPLFNRRDNWADCITAHRIAADSARVAGHRGAEAWALQNLGQALARTRDEEALPRLKEALAIRHETGDPAGEGQTMISLADAYYRLQGPRAAFDYSLRSLGSVRRTGNPALLATALNNHGEFCLELGRLGEAADCLREALAIWTAIGGHVRGYTMQNLGRVYLASARLNEAIASLEESQRIHQASGALMEQAVTLKYLAQAQHDAGHRDQARESLTAALALFEELNADAEAEAIRSALQELE